MNQIIDTKTPDIIGSIPDINGTIGAALTLEDQRESSRLIEEQAGLAFDMIQGEKVTRLNADIEDMQSTVQRSKQSIDEQEKPYACVKYFLIIIKKGINSYFSGKQIHSLLCCLHQHKNCV